MIAAGILLILLAAAWMLALWLEPEMADEDF